MESNTPNPYRVIEGQTATLICTITTANPNTIITWRWIKTDRQATVLHNGPTYTILSIQRGSSGSYSCTASNSVGTSDAATILLDVQCMHFYIQHMCEFSFKVCNYFFAWFLCSLTVKPSIEIKQRMIVNETERIVLTRHIYSNPLANVSWLDGTHLLQTQALVNTTSFIIERAQCTNTMNFTLVASNIVQSNITSRVEVIVNCEYKNVWCQQEHNASKFYLNLNAC